MNAHTKSDVTANILQGYLNSTRISLPSDGPLSVPPGSHISANLEGLRYLDFRSRKFSDESNFLEDKSNQRIPVDSACFCLYRVLNLGPVPIARVYDGSIGRRCAGVRPSGGFLALAARSFVEPLFLADQKRIRYVD